MRHFLLISILFVINSMHAFSGNKIYYVTTDNEPITPSFSTMEARVVSNTYTEASDIYPEGCWTMEFDADITTVDGFMKLTTLKSVTLPDGVTAIATFAFYGCSSLQDVHIPYGVKTIGDGAFAECDLRKVEIPTSVERILTQAFANNKQLAEIVLPETIEEIAYQSFDGTQWWADYRADDSNIYGNIIYVNDIAYSAVSQDITECTFKENTRRIGEYAFYGCRNLTRIDLPDGVESIGHDAFSNCDLKKVVFPASVKRIAPSAFSTNTWLSEVEFPETIEEIGHAAFSFTTWWINYSADKNNVFGNIIYIKDIAYCAASSDITACTFREGTRSIADVAFYGCKNLTQITIPDGLTKIGNSVFSGCSSLAEINIPESVTEIGNSAFAGCGMVTIELPQSITQIGSSAFSSCANLRSIVLPRNVTRIEPGTFSYCYSLSEIDIPDGVTFIGSRAFDWCRALEEITLPVSLKLIESRTFNMKTMRYYCPAATVPNAAPDAFLADNIKSAALLVPESLKSEYMTTYPWSEFGGFYNIDGTEGIRVISADEADEHALSWDLSGRKLDKPAKGQIYLQQGQKKIVR